MSLQKERSPRATKKFNVTITNIKDQSVSTLTSNVSVGGFAIQCNTAERYQLTPDGDIVDDAQPVHVNLQLEIQYAQKELIKTQCRIIYSRRIAQNKYQIGMSFITLASDDRDKLLTLMQNTYRE